MCVCVCVCVCVKSSALSIALHSFCKYFAGLQIICKTAGTLRCVWEEKMEMHGKKDSVSLTTAKKDPHFHEFLVLIFYTETRFTGSLILHWRQCGDKHEQSLSCVKYFFQLVPVFHGMSYYLFLILNLNYLYWLCWSWCNTWVLKSYSLLLLSPSV